MIIYPLNKYTMAMDNMIKELHEKGGIANFIALEPVEAGGFLREMKLLPAEIRNKIKIEQKHQSELDITLALRSNSKLSLEDLTDVVNKWYQGHYTITYDDVLLRVVQSPKKEEEAPRIPRIKAKSDWEKT